MCDYSVYEKPLRAPLNPKLKTSLNTKGENKIRFTIVLFKRRLNIILYKDSSLEGLYIEIYNAIYPDFSTEKMNDSIPPPNGSTAIKIIPKIYCVSVIDKKENMISVPLHRFITIDAFMKAKHEYFQNTAFIGMMPTFKIYVVDENFLENASSKKTSRSYVEKFLQCYTKFRNR